VAVLRVEAQRLARARELLGAGAPGPGLSAGAEALSYSISTATLQDVRKARPDGSVAVALGVLTQLVLEGATERSAKNSVVDLLRRRASDARMLAFRDSVVSDMRNGLAAGDAMDLRLRLVAAVLPSAGGVPTAADAVPLTAPATVGLEQRSPTTIRKPPFHR
jgi:hypothetical protein